MKKVIIVLCVLGLFCSLGIVFAEDETYTREQWLEAKKENVLLQLRLRQEIIQRMNNEIEVWKQEYQKVDKELTEIKAKAKVKPEGKPEKKETKK